MKEIREIDRATLTTEQKLGLVLCANLNHGDADVEYALEMIRERKLAPFGCIRSFPTAIA